MLSVVRAPSEENPTLGLRIMVQPMVVWLWIGGFVMVIGTALSLFPGRRRNPLDPVSAPAPIEQVDPPETDPESDAAPADPGPTGTGPADTDAETDTDAAEVDAR
jgi:cytochrome c-type biogenesis protein CcmF